MITLKNNKLLFLLGLLLPLLFSNFSIYKTIEEFNFDKLKKQKASYIDISRSGNEIYDSRISVIVEANSRYKSHIYPIKISKKYSLYHGCYDSISQSILDNKEYLQFNDTKINLDTLIKNNTNKQKVSKENYILFTRSIDFFEFNGKEFILLSARDRQFYRNLERNYWILLKIKDKKLLKAFCFIDGYVGGNDCFGDFNNDGTLDYLNWNFNKDKIFMYSLENDIFKIDNKHFIKLKQSSEQLEMTKDRGIVLVYDLFERKESKWFYKL